MALQHTLLGLLILHPRTGYDLYKRIESVPFLLESASLRRIYPTLKRMTDEGLVEFQVEPQEGRPDRKIYTVTESGEAEFLAWLGSPLDPADADLNMQPTLGKFFFYGVLDKETLLTRLSDALDARKEQLRKLESVPIQPPLGPYGEIVDSARVTVVWHTMLDYAQALTETQVRWLQDVVHTVETEL